MAEWISRLVRDERGATAIEYGLIVAAMFLAIVGAVAAFTGGAVDIFETASAALVAVMR